MDSVAAQAMDQCSGCRFWFAPKALPPSGGHATGYEPRGLCRRYPATLAKLPTEWCGEHKPREA